MSISVDVQHDAFDLATLVTGAVATGVALAGFIWTIILYRGERERREAAEALADRAQADRIASWVTVGPGQMGAIMRMCNRSDLPVSNVEWYNFDASGRVMPVEVGVLPPGEELPAVARNPELFPTEAGAVVTYIQAFSFADARNRAWLRHWDGTLTLLAEVFDMRVRGKARSMARPSWIPVQAAAGSPAAGARG